MANYQKKNVKKLKAVKPKKRTVAENYKIRAFDETKIDDDIPVKTAEQAKNERRFQKQKQRYLNKEQPQKRVVISQKSPSELNRSASSLRVLVGTKRIKTLKRIISVGIIVAFILTITIFHLTSPTGVSELISNYFVKMGSGTGFPVTINGDSVYDIKNFDDCIAVISDTHFEVYNSKSKELLSEQHGFGDPVLLSSYKRALIFDRSGKDLFVYNLSEKLISKKMKDEIITASIGRNGTFAVATNSKKSASKLYVFDKNDNELFSWNSQSGRINSVAVSNSGETVAITTIKVDGGKYRSNIIVFNSQTGKKAFSTEKNELAYSVDAKDSGYCLLTESALLSITEETLDEKVLMKDKISCFASSDRFGYIAALGVNNSIGETKTVVFGDENVELFNDTIQVSPSSLTLGKNFFAFASEKRVYVSDFEGNILSEFETPSVSGKTVLIDNSIFYINNMVLDEVKIELNAEDK